MTVLGLVTIGQAPRVDVTPDILPLLAGHEVIERGALDDLGAAAIGALAAEPGRAAVVSRLRDGSSAVLDEDRLRPLVQSAVDRVVADGAEAVLILCTGHLPGLAASVPVYTAEELARGAAAVLVGERALGVLVPTPRQVEDIAARWRADLGRDASVAAADPYAFDAEAFAEAGRALAASGTEWIFLDCIGYSEEMAAVVTRATGLRAVTARSLAARMLAAAV